jgi:hypothetical protein
LPTHFHHNSVSKKILGRGSLNPLTPDQETITGTILVNSDCTATATIKVFHSGNLNRIATLDLVFDDNLREVRGVFTSAFRADGTQVGTVLTFDGKKQFRRG